jgi:very-short-patch-repair endonuclease
MTEKTKPYGGAYEKEIEELLIKKGIRYSREQRLDFYLIDFNLLIEADGDYWHVNPIKYSENDILTERQQINVENDK